MVYDGINAKVRAMKGRLLKYDDYYMLSQYKAVDDIGRKIREYGRYEKVVPALGGEKFHRELIEQKILLSLSADFARIYSFISDYSLRRYLDAYYLQYEIGTIKILLCSVFAGEAMPYSENDLSALLLKELNIDIPMLTSSKTVNEFIENLRGTVFHKILSKKYADGVPSLFELEALLDIYYYTNIWRLQEKLDKRNQKAMKHINGTEIDLVNILWLYRLKTYYKINGSRIYAYLIPVRYRLSQEQIAEMAGAQSADGLWSAIEGTGYGAYFSRNKPIENGFFATMNKVYAKAQINSPNSLVSAVSYLHFKEVEIRNVVSLIEGVRYGLGQEDILSYLQI